MELISLLLSIVATVVSVVALFLQYRDRPNVVIREFWPVLFATKNDGSSVWKQKIEYISLEIENTGNTIAFNVSAFVTFPGLDALPMTPMEGETGRVFDLRPKEKLELWGTWNEDTDYYSKDHLLPSEFLKSGVPATAKVSFGGKEIMAVISRVDAESHFQKDQESMYR